MVHLDRNRTPTILPEPRANPDLIGHAAAEALLVDTLRSARLHHGWLITGPQGVGKATLAYRFARRLLAGGAPEGTLALSETQPTFKRVAAATHADLLTVEREWDEKRNRFRGEIVIKDVLRVADFLHLTPAEGGWRVVVVDGAEDLNRSAANALLKMLEEPPPRAILLLVCSAAGRLLPTIRSRCRRLRLNALSSDEMSALLAKALPAMDAAERLRLASLADGSPGRALQLADEGGIALAKLVAGVLKRMPGTRCRARLQDRRRARTQRGRVQHLHGPATRLAGHRSARRRAWEGGPRPGEAARRPPS